MGKQRKMGNGELRVIGLEPAFGAVLRSYRLAKNFTQEELALETGLDRGYLSRLERGMQCPTLTTVYILAHILEVPAVQFLKDIEASVKVER